MALLKEKKDGYVFFIDSTQKDTDGDGFDDINGVTERNYKENDLRLKSYGIMKIKYKI